MIILHCLNLGTSMIYWPSTLRQKDLRPPVLKTSSSHRCPDLRLLWSTLLFFCRLQLMFMATRTRPDILTAVCALATKCKEPREADEVRLRRISSSSWSWTCHQPFRNCCHRHQHEVLDVCCGFLNQRNIVARYTVPSNVDHQLTFFLKTTR